MTSRCSSYRVRWFRNQIYKSDCSPYHPKFMTIFIYKYGPVLCRVWVVVDLFGDLLAEPCFLGKPLAPESSNGMPPYLDDARLPADISLARRYDVRFVAEPE